jgi:hypothetical protein
VYYDLAAARDANPKQFGDVAIARVEQISPFPFDLVAEEQKRFPNAEIVWAQEEPMNMGAWTYVQPRIETALKATTQRRAVRLNILFFFFALLDAKWTYFDLRVVCLTALCRSSAGRVARHRLGLDAHRRAERAGR